METSAEKPSRYERGYSIVTGEGAAFLHSAALLRADGDFDSACSRLYYAMFYCAEALLDTRHLEHSSHRAVISGFGQHFVKTGDLPAEMHEWLREAFDKRQAGDYTSQAALTEADALDLESKAARFIEQTEQFLKSHGHL